MGATAQLQRSDRHRGAEGERGMVKEKRERERERKIDTHTQKCNAVTKNPTRGGNETLMCV